MPEGIVKWFNGEKGYASPPTPAGRTSSCTTRPSPAAGSSRWRRASGCPSRPARARRDRRLTTSAPSDRGPNADHRAGAEAEAVAAPRVVGREWQILPAAERGEREHVALRWELPWYLRSRNRWPNWAVRPVVQREHAADAGNRVHGDLQLKITPKMTMRAEDPPPTTAPRRPPRSAGVAARAAPEVAPLRTTSTPTTAPRSSVEE
jgi:hypothetical protein